GPRPEGPWSGPRPISDGEEEKESDEQREDAQSFRNGEAEYETAELAVGSRRVAQSTGEVAAEDVAEAEGRAGETKGGKTCPDDLACSRCSVELLDWVVAAFNRRPGGPGTVS